MTEAVELPKSLGFKKEGCRPDNRGIYGDCAPYYWCEPAPGVIAFVRFIDVPYRSRLAVDVERRVNRCIRDQFNKPPFDPKTVEVENHLQAAAVIHHLTQELLSGVTND